MSDSTDRVTRVMTGDYAFRVIALSATDTVRQAAAAQGAAGRTLRLLSDLLVGAILVRETMAPFYRVQVSIRGVGGKSLLADSHPDGSTRGLTAGLPSGTEIELGSEAQLQVSRILPRTGLHQSLVQLDGEGGVPGALVRYMQDSEQVESMISIATAIQGDQVARAAGFIVQKLPEGDHESVLVMRRRIETRFADFAADVRAGGGDPTAVIDAILEGAAYHVLETSTVRFGCQCSFERVLGALAALQRTDIEELLSGGEVLEISCDYCRSSYEVGPDALRALLAGEGRRPKV